MADYMILVLDKQLNVIGDPITEWTSIDVTLKFNETSSGLFTAPGYSWIRDQFVPGCRVVVIRDGDVLIAGPAETWLWERSDDGDDGGAGTFTVNFADFLSLIVARQTFPDGSLTPEAQTVEAWSYNDMCEHALRNLVLFNAGPSALAERQIPKLELGAFAGVGTSALVTAERMEPMGDVMRRVAATGGGLGFKATLVGFSDPTSRKIEFTVFDPPDLSNQVVFGFGAGSLKYVATETTAPTVNAAIVGAQGEGADRYVIGRNNYASQDAWDRRETLVSRPGNDPLAELQADGDEALAEGAETVRVPTSVADTPDQKFGRDYNVGDRVSVETAPGSMLSDVVVTVHLQVFPTSGEYVSATIGSQAEISDPVWIQRMRAIDRRVAYLERNVRPAVI